MRPSRLRSTIHPSLRGPDSQFPGPRNLMRLSNIPSPPSLTLSLLHAPRNFKKYRLVVTLTTRIQGGRGGEKGSGWVDGFGAETIKGMWIPPVRSVCSRSYDPLSAISISDIKLPERSAKGSTFAAHESKVNSNSWKISGRGKKRTLEKRDPGRSGLGDGGC
ncbi:hypothetical protein BDV93DRAFT_297906 [Ceratobasidium sp. AG-I]|nr:hypothetical protein BDV93DRAFT_297906 [Ceratobasidium sp. AG-I]